MPWNNNQRQMVATFLCRHYWATHVGGAAIVLGVGAGANEVVFSGVRMSAAGAPGNTALQVSGRKLRIIGASAGELQMPVLSADAGGSVGSFAVAHGGVMARILEVGQAGMGASQTIGELSPGSGWVPLDWLVTADSAQIQVVSSMWQIQTNGSACDQIDAWAGSKPLVSFGVQVAYVLE